MKQKLNHFAIFVLAGALLTACGNPEQASSSNKQASSYANASSTSSVSSSSSSSSKQTESSSSISSSSSSDNDTDKMPLDTMQDTTETTGVYGDGVSFDTSKLSRVDQCSDSDKRGGDPSYMSIVKDGKRVNAIYFSQTNSASTYWSKTDGNKNTYKEGSGSYNNNGYSEFRFAKTFDATITGTMTVEFDYVLTNLNVTTPAIVEAAKKGASGVDGRENDGTYVAQYAAKATAVGTEWPNGINLDQANYRAGENGYTVEGFFQNDAEWHHTKIQRAIASTTNGVVTFKLYHWVGEIAVTNFTITAA